MEKPGHANRQLTLQEQRTLDLAWKAASPISAITVGMGAETLKALLDEEFKESARRAEKLLALRDDAELSFHRIREALANGLVDEAFEIANSQAARYRKPLNEMGLDRSDTPSPAMSE